ALIPLPDDRANLRRSVAQAEIPVAVSVRFEIAHLAAHPQRDERAFDHVLRRLREHADADRRAHGLARVFTKVHELRFRLAHRRLSRDRLAPRPLTRIGRCVEQLERLAGATRLTSARHYAAAPP